MKVFATNYLETWSDDIDGGNDWSWMPVNMPNKQTGPGHPTKSDVITKQGQDSNEDSDQPVETAGMLVA